MLMMDLSSISLCKFSPLTTPLMKKSPSKRITHCIDISDTESVVNRDLKKLAKSVKKKLNEASDTDHILTDTEIVFTKLQDKNKMKMKATSKADISSSEVSSVSSLSDSEVEESVVSPKKKLQTARDIGKESKLVKDKKQASLANTSKTLGKQKRTDSLSSNDSSKENSNKAKGGNVGKPNGSSAKKSKEDQCSKSVKRGRSSSLSSSSSESSSEDSESVKSPRKKIKLSKNISEKENNVDKTKGSSRNLNAHSVSDSDVSIVSSNSNGETDKRNKSRNKSDSSSSGIESDSYSGGGKEKSSTKSDNRPSKVSAERTKGAKKTVANAKRASNTETADKNKRYKVPEGFVDDTSQKCLTSQDIKGKQLWLIMAPDDVDMSGLHGQHISMSSSSHISIETDEGEKQYEVIPQAFMKNEMKTFNSVTVNSEGDQKYVIGPEIAGQIQVMPWIPTMPPVVLDRSKAAKHSIPDDLRQKLQPFGSESPPRNTDDIEVSVEKKHKHKKKKKKKNKKTDD